MLIEHVDGACSLQVLSRTSWQNSPMNGDSNGPVGLLRSAQPRAPTSDAGIDSKRLLGCVRWGPRRLRRNWMIASRPST